MEEIVLWIGNQLETAAAWVVGGPQLVIVFTLLGALTAGGLLTLWVVVDTVKARRG